MTVLDVRKEHELVCQVARVLSLSHIEAMNYIIALRNAGLVLRKPDA